jgi:hypothetical protein
MNSSKLSQLRAKTDRQLVTVIGRRLETGLDLARRSCAIEAKSVFREVSGLLPLVNGVSEIEKQRLRGKLAHLESELRRAAAARAPIAC